MGDRTWTGIQFSGIISREVADELLGHLDDQCNTCNDGPALVAGHAECKFTIEHLRFPHNQFTDDECNYGTMETVEACCRENHISYFKTWAAGGDYGPGFEIYNAIVDQSWQCADIDGDPVIGLDALIKAHDEGKIDDMIGYLKGFRDWEENYPPLEIQDDLVIEGEAA